MQHCKGHGFKKFSWTNVQALVSLDLLNVASYKGEHLTKYLLKHASLHIKLTTLSNVLALNS